MTDNASQQVDNLRRQLADGERGGSEADREALLGFSDRLKLLASESTDYRHDKLLRHCTTISEGLEGSLADAPRDRDTAERAVRWTHDAYENPRTNRDYRVELRRFGKRLAETREDIRTDRDGQDNVGVKLLAQPLRVHDRVRG